MTIVITAGMGLAAAVAAPPRALAENNGLAVIVAGHAGKVVTGAHTKVTGTMGDLFLTLANGPMQASLANFPTADQKLPGVVA